MKKAIEKYSIPYEKDDDLAAIIDAIGDAKIVLLGEASHGTSEFYTVRAELSKRLIEEKAFSAITVEGDWPSSQRVNRYIKGFKGKNMTTREVLQGFDRWPTWMWANKEVEDLVDWMKLHNDQQSEGKKVGFYGLDLYSLWESMEEVLEYLTHSDPTGVNLGLAKKVSDCFEAFNRLPEHYAISTAHFPQTCTAEVVGLLSSIRAHKDLYPTENEENLNLKMNALVTKNAEAYYRISAQSNAQSWNIRDEHMVETINELRDYHGEDEKVIVWEHNTHIGDARATAMKDEKMVNVGQLLREQNKKGDVYAVGFGTHRGTVIAGDEWGAPYEIMEVPPAKKDSWENILHETGSFNKLLIFNDENRTYFGGWIGHRAIGVVYNPKYESYGNYVPSVIGNRYDAFIYIDEATALKPLNGRNTNLNT